MLHHCNKRLKELDQKDVLDAKPGNIVLVGDPANDLPASVEEVKFIENLFGEEHVKKLVGPEATPAKVLEWAKYPSEKGVKQVVFHIAAHGIGEVDRGKVGIILSRPPISSQQNDGKLGIYEWLVMAKADMLLTHSYMHMVRWGTQIVCYVYIVRKLSSEENLQW